MAKVSFLAENVLIQAPILFVFAYLFDSVVHGTYTGLFAVAGILFTDALVHVLKAAGKRVLPLSVGERPCKLSGSCTYDCSIFQREGPARGYGMPSGHAACAAFVATFTIMYILDANTRLGTRPRTQALLRCVPVIVLCFLVAGYRCYSRCHSFTQVLVGSILGICIGYVTWRFASSDAERLDKPEDQQVVTGGKR